MAMALTQKTVRLIVALMVVSLTGLVVLQASLLSDAFESKEASFRRNVQAAIGSITDHLEAAETISATLHVVGDAGEIVLRTHRSDLCPDFVGGDRTVGNRSALELWRNEIEGLGTLQLENLDVAGDSRFFAVESVIDSAAMADSLLLRRDGQTLDSTRIVVRYSIDSSGTVLTGTVEGSDSSNWREVIDSGRVDLISRVMDQLVQVQKVAIEERIDTTGLDSLISHTLHEFGITLEPIYGIIAEADSSLLLQHPTGYAEKLLSSEFRSDLFPHDILAAPNSLALYFPQRGIYVLKQMGLMLISTVIFMLIVVVSFAYTVRTIIAQRRTAQLMVDFVNNLTHEFKTPISTVALACEAIMRPDVIGNPEKVSRFSRMILDENRRMRHQAEKILQMAALEEKESRLKFTDVDLHEVIRNAVESIALQVEKRGGCVECSLAARNPVLRADEVHLGGIVYNLLDNAVKYSLDVPRITIRTADTDGGLGLAVEDRGLGLKPEDQKRIFDKYFRVSHGNVHDVKGFGLGLSYVRLMVRAHGGRIAVESEPGRGTRMNLWFPVSSEATGQSQEARA